MKVFSLIPVLFVTCAVFFLSSCSKGYEVRFVNYYIEPMDSVVIGNNILVFTNIDLESQSEYQKIGKGNHTIKCISKNKKKFYSVLVIPKNGDGKRTIQIDAINSISILED